MIGKLGDVLYVVGVIVATFILTAAAVGLWIGLVQRFVWIAAP